MESMYGPGIDPTPFIAAAYLIGFFGLLGFSLWIFWQRKELRRLAEAAQISNNR